MIRRRRVPGDQRAVLGSWSWVVLLAVLVSAVASTQTTILPAARGTLAMGVYRALPTQFAKIHPKFKTPTVSTLFIGGVAIVIYGLLSLLGENAYATCCWPSVCRSPSITA